jgi:putative ABC transport system permease protein
MSFAVSQRTREIGIRAALGAEPRRIVKAIFSRAVLQLGAGVILGVILALAEDDEGLRHAAVALAPVAVIIMAAGLLACVVPARRALRIQPTEALRGEG